MSKIRLGLLAAAGITLSGCGLPPALMVASYVAEGVLVAASGKTLGDHALSEVAQQDCAIWRVLRGDDICKDYTIIDEAEIMLASGEMPTASPDQIDAPIEEVVAQPIAQDDAGAIQLAQVYLNNLGYGAGPIDGVAGPQTQAAAQAYGADMDRPSDNGLTYDDLDYLSDHFGTAAMEGPSLVKDHTTTILLAQAHLDYFGYQPGPLDGISGPSTRNAIARFQHDKGLDPNGQASVTLVATLRSDLPDWSTPALATKPDNKTPQQTASIR